MNNVQKKMPGIVRDAILSVLNESDEPMSVAEIERNVEIQLGPTSGSSVRSYLRLNTPKLFAKDERGIYRVNSLVSPIRRTAPDSFTPDGEFQFGRSTLLQGDCIGWLRAQPKESIHAVVTDPPYGLYEYSAEQVEKLRAGKGGVWRIPPSFDGNQRSPLPRFTTLTKRQLDELSEFFYDWAKLLIPVLVPGANVIIASNPLLSYLVSNSLALAGLERRGEIVRLTQTMRGGDRPKNAHKEFPDVSVMPRSMWEPWLVFRKPLNGRVQDNLRNWATGGFRRISEKQPFGDVIASSPTSTRERKIGLHESLKPQSFLRQLVRAALPLGSGIVLDPFAGTGSTLAACEANGYKSIGIERDTEYFMKARKVIPALVDFDSGEHPKANGRSS
jgi:DNA modification methylase